MPSMLDRFIGWSRGACVPRRLAAHFQAMSVGLATGPGRVLRGCKGSAPRTFIPIHAHAPSLPPTLVLQRYPTLLTQPQWTRLLSESHRRSFGVLRNQLEGRFLVAFARPTPPAPP